MNTDVSELPDFLAKTDPTWLAGAGLLIAVSLIVIIWLIYKLRHPSDETRVEKIVKEFGDEYIKDAILSDGLYGYHFIDYLILLPEKILVLAVQDYEGYIFGGEKIEKWAQVVNNRSFNFDNPLINTHHYVQAVRALCDDAEVINRVVFTSRSSFPKGIPDGVVQLKDLRKELESLRGHVPGGNPANALKNVWNRLLDSVKKFKSQYKQELSTAA